MVPLAFSPCGVQGKLKFLLSSGFIVFCCFILYTHFEILAVLVINNLKSVLI